MDATAHAPVVGFEQDDLWPLRGESYSAEHLDQHFQHLAHSQRLVTSGIAGRVFSTRFETNARGIVQAHKRVTKSIRSGEILPAEAEWLLDNFYVVEEQLREIRDDLPRGFYEELPKTESGFPRVYEIAKELVVHTDSSMDAALIERSVQSFQSVSPLSIGETWAVPIMLRLVLVENLHRLCKQMLLTLHCRHTATEMVENWDKRGRFDIDLCDEPQCLSTVIQLLEQLPDHSREFREAVTNLEQRVSDHGWILSDIARAEHQRQASNQVSIGNVITSMRLIASLDWISFFERVNHAEHVLNNDPSGVYEQMHFESRDRYRHAVEEIAKRTKQSDIEIARQVVAMAAAHTVPSERFTHKVNVSSDVHSDTVNGRDVHSVDARASHVGYWLVDAGRRLLDKRVGYRRPLSRLPLHLVASFPNAFYFSCLTLLTGLALWGLVGVLVGAGVTAGLIALFIAVWLLPVSELAQSVTNLLVTNCLSPKLLPRFEFKDGVPLNNPTIVVVPSMLSSAREVDSLLQRLESHYLANSDEALSFALLTDFMDANAQTVEKDQPLVDRVVEGIRSLNHRYLAQGRAPFYLFHRHRQWNASEGRWMGWERKRGKLMEFGKLLQGASDTSYSVQEGDLLALEHMRSPTSTPFVITLDSDTQLPYDAARKMVGTISHPLNRPHFGDELAGADKNRNKGQVSIVTRGYSILQPRVSVQLESAAQSWYSKLHAGSPGVDPYVTATSDVYQDLFGEGSFTGKGIYDLHAFERALGNAFPANSILSHDLIEGCHARVGLVTNIEVFDGYPSQYEADAKRLHRWVRGDWQLLPWLLPVVPYANGWKRNPMSWLSWWKIADNLRRSLVAPSLLVAMFVGWHIVPRQAWLWTAMATVVLFFPVLAQLILTAIRWPWKNEFREQLRCATADLLKTLAQCTLSVTTLPHKALSMLDAVGRTLWRLAISRSHLLEWETAAAVEHRLQRSRTTSLLQLWMLPTLALVLAATLPWPAKLAAVGFLALWLAGPWIVEWVNQPIRHNKQTLDEDQSKWLRQLVSETWSFFEAYVGPDDNWLPVDNVQEEPKEKIAHRLSPTNEGLFLVSALIARKFGYIGLPRLTELLEHNLDSVDQLQKMHGHIFNWYDTQTLQPLSPRYVSTVDSGNLVACLLTLHAGIHELLDTPLQFDTLQQGLRDSLDLLTHACRDVAVDDPAELRNYAAALSEKVALTHASLQSAPVELPIAGDSIGNAWTNHISMLRTVRELADWLSLNTFAESPKRTDNSRYHRLRRKTRVVHARLESVIAEFDLLYSWANSITVLTQPSTVTGSESLPRQSQSTNEPVESLFRHVNTARSLNALAHVLVQDDAPGSAGAGTSVPATGPNAWQLARQAIQTSASAADSLKQRLLIVAQRAEELAIGMDFRFLYSSQRRLFSIGFNIDDGMLDRSHYDMLCSESRLASYLAIAKGDVEATHWFRLGRHATLTAGQFTLLSWGGTMFEYLMPPLFQRQFEGSMLMQSCRAAINKQQRYAAQHKVPWGISESAFGSLAVNTDYHYRSFGVPGLGLKRGLAKDLVISPYSTMMALGLDTHASLSNLKYLEEEGAHGHWGFYEALDYTAERVPVGKRRLVVRCYMAHHHGMSLLSLANLLHGGLVQRWFNAHRLPRSSELLLQERVPRGITPYEANADESDLLPKVPEEQQLTSRRLTGVFSPNPRTHLLSNGAYSIMLSSVGSGYSRINGVDVMRWRSDTTTDNWGQYIYLRDLQNGLLWSPTYQPTCVEPDHYEVIFSIDKVDFHRIQDDLETLLEIAISPENNAEVRQLRITNHGDEPRLIEVTSYAEISLAKPAADLAHPAFQKLFLETEYIAEESAIIARRRPRDMHQPADWAVHVLATPGEGVTNIQYETSRQAFIGRGRSARAPLAMEQADLSGTTGAVLDPIFSLRCHVEVPPGGSITIAISTGVAQNRQDALALADQFHELRNVQRVFELAWAFAQVELRHQHLTPEQVHLFQKLASYLLYPHSSLRGDEQLIAQNRMGQSSLWRHGISGDIPILLAHVNDPEQLLFVRDLAMAQRFWRERGFQTDLVIINDYPGSYYDALHDQVIGLLREIYHSPDHPGVYLIRGSQLPREELALFETVAACVLHGDRGTIGQQIEDAQSAAKLLASAFPTVVMEAATSSRLRTTQVRKYTARDDSFGSLEYWNGLGGFAEDGQQYRIRVRRDNLPPMPWTQVVANPRLGFIVTESGGGYTWFENSRENKLTRWSNDPISDTPAEVLYVHEPRTGVTRCPMNAMTSDAQQSMQCSATYGAGYAEYQQEDDSLLQTVELSVAPLDPVKFVKLRLSNRTSSPRQLMVSYFAELVLGVSREQSQWHLQTAIDTTHEALMVRNPYHPEYASQVMFVKSLSPLASFTADRMEFLGRNGHWERPMGVSERLLSGRVGYNADPCAALQIRIDLAAFETYEVTFLIGAGKDEQEVYELLGKYSGVEVVNEAIHSTRQQWRETLGQLQVKTPNRALDILVNNWLIYQVLCCRMWARSAFYQSGGAFGFRDQLQDSMALVNCRPDLVRTHLLLAASRQFKEGDVQHWWHPPLGKGTRTRFSDDLLWLPYVACHYVQVSRDQSVWDEVASFLESPELLDWEMERYEQPRTSSESGTLYDHCLRAIDHSLKFGEHGLPLMGCGDWNDGMNKVGEGGKGESVWVGWFLLAVIEKILPIMRLRGDAEKALVYEETCRTLRAAIEANAWDGQWYRRAYFDDGTPLGSASNDECQIDSLTQSWSVIAGGQPERAEMAMRHAVDRLVRRDDGLILLFEPPFDQGELDPGYIKGYLPGIRENGGQYTHAATWMIQAVAQLGQADLAMELLDVINPINHTSTTAGVAQYQTEPYVVAADVYGIAPHQGRGGWTWYTGSAAWLYRVIVEELLGVKVSGDSVSLEPHVPESWNEFEIRLANGETMRWDRNED